MNKTDIKNILESSELLLKKKENELECLNNHIKQIRENIDNCKIQLCKFKVGEIVKIKGGSDCFNIRYIWVGGNTRKICIQIYKDTERGIINDTVGEDQLQKIN